MKIAILLTAGLILTGCASSPPRLVTNQYCNTYQTVETKNGEKVDANTTIKCSDDPIEKYAPLKMGIAKDCYATSVNTNRGREKFYVCKRFDGTYDVIESIRID